MSKFQEKNIDNIIKLNNYIDENRDNIHLILVSYGIFPHFHTLDDY